MPTPEEAVRLWTERHVRELKDAASSAIYEGYLGLAAQLKARPDADELIALLLRVFFNHRRQEKAKASGEQTWEERKDERRAADFAKDREREARGGRGGRGGREDRPRDRDRGGDRKDRERPPRMDRGPKSEGGDESQADAKTQENPVVAKPKSDREMFESLGGGAGPVASARPIPESAKGPGGEGGERGERKGRDRERGLRREKKTEQPPVPEGHVRLWFNLGRMDGLDKESFVTALENAGAPSGKVPQPDLMGTFSYVTVPEADAPALEALVGKKVGEKGIKVERAKR
jgi:ATP-dependent RNA helicase DeaD